MAPFCILAGGTKSFNPCGEHQAKSPFRAVVWIPHNMKRWTLMEIGYQMCVGL